MPGLPYLTRTMSAPAQPGVAVPAPVAPGLGDQVAVQAPGQGTVASAGGQAPGSGQVPAPMLQPGAQRPTRYVAPPLKAQAREPLQATLPAAQAQSQAMDQPMAAPQGLIRGAVKQ